MTNNQQKSGRVKSIELLAATGLTLAVLLAPSPSYSQSFKCSNATRTTEFAICNSENLILLDEEMATMYANKLRTISTKPAKQAYSRQSRDWLKQRNACKSDFACLEMRYRERIEQLKNS